MTHPRLKPPMLIGSLRQPIDVKDAILEVKVSLEESISHPPTVPLPLPPPTKHSHTQMIIRTYDLQVPFTGQEVRVGVVRRPSACSRIVRVGNTPFRLATNIA